MSARVLVLDDVCSYLQHVEGEPPKITKLEWEDVNSPNGIGSYRLSARAKRLASNATAKKYDLVIIGNNQGTGLELASLLQEELRPKTLIVWNSPSHPDEQRSYANLGYAHFGTRTKMGEWYSEQVVLL